MSNVKELMWGFLIKKGQILQNTNYYGNDCDYKTTEQIRLKLELDTLCIDWGKTRDVVDDSREVFNGTDADASYVNYLKGNLVLCDGREYEFQYDLDRVHSTCEMIELILSSSARGE